MKVAIACDDRKVAKIFGYCDYFMLFDLVDNIVVKKDKIINPGHKKRFLPKFLDILGVDVIIAGSMGENAFELFREQKQQVFLGVNDEIENTLSDFLQGNLKSTNQIYNCSDEE